MLPLFIIFFSSFVVAFSGAMMPGPLLTVTISESSRVGFRAGPLLIAGHAFLELILIGALFLGLRPLFENELFFVVVAFLGGGIMLWMAWGMIKSLPTLSIRTKPNLKRKNNLLISGALMSLANPYWIIWWTTIGIGYIVQSQKFGLVGVSAFYLGHIAGDLIWYSAISYAITKGKKLLTDNVYRILIGVCGVFLVVFSVYLIFSALEIIK